VIASRLNELDAWQAATLVARRELRCVDLVRACLDRVVERDGEVRAFVTLDPDAALAQARGLDAGPLRGLPLGVKDLFDTVDLPTSLGADADLSQAPISS
jgi:Asp-tRNA(Asn)/Glu-tRNA(Gln) amidotransferase A subunit family amidase